MPGPGRTVQTRDAEEAVLAEDDRVEELVVDPAVDHIDTFESFGGAHEDLAIVDQEVTAFHQLDAHLPGEECVLEVCRVGHPGGQNNHGGIVGVGWGDGAQGTKQRRPIVVDGPDDVAGETDREDPGHRHPVLEDIGDPARHSQIVLEHAIRPLVVADDVDPGHHAARASRGGDAVGLADISVRRLDQPAGDDPVVDRLLTADVEIVEEAVEDGHPLYQPGLDMAPLIGGDDPGHQVHRPGALETALVTGDGEGDAERAKERIEQPETVAELGVSDLGETIHQGLVVRTYAVGAVNLVEAAHRRSVLRALFPNCLGAGQMLASGCPVSARTSVPQNWQFRRPGATLDWQDGHSTIRSRTRSSSTPSWRSSSLIFSMSRSGVIPCSSRRARVARMIITRRSIRSFRSSIRLV